MKLMEAAVVVDLCNTNQVEICIFGCCKLMYGCVFFLCFCIKGFVLSTIYLSCLFLGLLNSNQSCQMSLKVKSPKGSFFVHPEENAINF